MISQYKLGIQDLSLKQISVKKLEEALTAEFKVAVDGFESLKQMLGHEPDIQNEEAFEEGEEEILEAEMARSGTMDDDLAEDLQFPVVKKPKKRRKRTTTLASTEATSSILEDYWVIEKETTITPEVITTITPEVIKVVDNTNEEFIKTEPPSEIADNVTAQSY